MAETGPEQTGSVRTPPSEGGLPLGGGVGHASRPPRKAAHRSALMALAPALIAFVVAAATAAFWLQPGDRSAQSPAAPSRSSSGSRDRDQAPRPAKARGIVVGEAPPLASEQREVANEAQGLDADSALSAFLRTFYVRTANGAHFKLSTAGGRATFWQHAEMIALIEDAYERSHQPRYRAMIDELCRGVTAHYGRSWLFVRSNDDAMWMIIAWTRASILTHRKAYLDRARRMFDQICARAWGRDLGGGLWETVRRQTKNACVNAPAVIAASLLYQQTHVRAYLRKAQRIYRWLYATLYDPATGAVYDHVARPTGQADDAAAVIDRSTYTYNQGTFIGAGDLLSRLTPAPGAYVAAQRALAYTQASLTVNGVLRSEVSGPAIGSPGGGFKGIFARWGVRFIRTHHLTGYGPWLDANIAAIRRAADQRGLIDEDWSTPTGSGILPSFACSSAVAMLQAWPR